MNLKLSMHIFYFLLENCSEVKNSSAVSEGEVVSWLRSLLESSIVSVVTKQYALLSLAKLSTRFTHVTQVKRDNI